MKVAIVGPGAMGCLFAARLTRGGVKVWLIDHDKERTVRLGKSGIRVEAGNQSLDEHPKVATSIPTGLDLIVVLTKSFSTVSLRFPPQTPVLTLQNGLGNVETLCTLLGSARVLAGTTSEASTLLGEGHVRHIASGVTSFGGWTSCVPELAAQVLEAGGFQVTLTDAPGQIIWEKLAINAGINPLTALLNVPNGRLLESFEIRGLLRDLVLEAAKVATAEGYRFDSSLVEAAELMCRNTAENISSMLQDIRAGKPTEIEAISGEVLRRGRRAALPTPRTRVVYQLVRGLENR